MLKSLGPAPITADAVKPAKVTPYPSPCKMWLLHAIPCWLHMLGSPKIWERWAPPLKFRRVSGSLETRELACRISSLLVQAYVRRIGPWIKSLKIVKSNTDRSGTCNFLFIIHRKYGLISCHFLFRSKNDPIPCIKRQRWRCYPSNIVTAFRQKLQWGLTRRWNSLMTCTTAFLTKYQHWTDRQTDRQTGEETDWQKRYTIALSACWRTMKTLQTDVGLTPMTMMFSKHFTATHQPLNETTPATLRNFCRFCSILSVRSPSVAPANCADQKVFTV